MEEIEKEEEEAGQRDPEPGRGDGAHRQPGAAGGVAAAGGRGGGRGRVLPPLLGLLGMAAIGGLSLWRSYRTTVRLYTGQYRRRRPGGRRAGAAPAAGPAVATAGLMEKESPGLSERVAAVALCGFRSLHAPPRRRCCCSRRSS